MNCQPRGGSLPWTRSGRPQQKQRRLWRGSEFDVDAARPLLKHQVWQDRRNVSKQPDSSASTREAKRGCVFTQTVTDEDGNPTRNPDFTSYVGTISCNSAAYSKARTSKPPGKSDGPSSPHA